MDTNLTSINDKRAQLAEQLSENADSMRTIKADWLKLMQDGLVVNLHIRRWRMTTRLTLQDLGLDDSENAEEQRILDEIMQVGEKYLFPQRFMKTAASIDAGARQSIKRFGYKTFWGYFVPATAWEDFKAQMKIYEERYMQLRDEVSEQWEDSVSITLYNYKAAARAAYKRLVKISGSAAKWGNEFDFVETYVKRIENSIPKASKVYDQFAFEVEMNYIPLPALLAEDEEKARVMRAQANQEIQESNAVMQMRLDVQRAAQQSKNELIETFQRDIMTQLQETAYNAALDVLEALKRNDGEMQAKSVVQLKNMLDTVQRLNFYGDTDIERMMKDVKSKLVSNGREGYNGAEISRTLTDIAVETRMKLQRMGAKVRSGREANLPEIDALVSQRGKRKAVSMQLEIEVDTKKRNKRSI